MATDILHIEIFPGSQLHDACCEAQAVAINMRQSVAFDFNGIEVTATPETSVLSLERFFDEECERRSAAYKASPEGIKAAQERESEILRHNESVASAFKALPGVLALTDGDGRLDHLMEWLRDFTTHADDISVEWDKCAGVKNGKEWLLLLLQSAGFRTNEGVGNPPEWFSTRERFGRYIIGQAMECVKGGMPPHPITGTFVEKYFCLPAAN